MTISIIAIKGNHLDKTATIFEVFNYVDTNDDKAFDSLETAEKYLYGNYFDFANRGIAIRGIWFDNGWTVISDPEMVDSSDSQALERLSQSLNAEVFSFLIQSTSGAFMFGKFDQKMQRLFFASEGVVNENFGEPLKVEMGLTISGKIFMDDILKIAANLGIDLAPANSKMNIVVKQLAYNEALQKELQQLPQNPAQTAPNSQKPWWKFW